MSNSFGLDRRGQCSPITVKAERRHDTLGLILSLLSSQPDTQFHSNKHEIDSKDQIQTVCNWKFIAVGQGVYMKSLVCL